DRELQDSPPLPRANVLPFLVLLYDDTLSYADISSSFQQRREPWFELPSQHISQLLFLIQRVDKSLLVQFLDEFGLHKLRGSGLARVGAFGPIENRLNAFG